MVVCANVPFSSSHPLSGSDVVGKPQTDALRVRKAASFAE